MKINLYVNYKKNIYKNRKIIVRYLVFLVALLYFSMFFWIFFYSPYDALQGILVKIIYIHVPCAWLSMASYFLMGIFAILYVTYKNIFYDIIVHSLSIVSLHSCIVALVTGSIWGKAAWGTFWVWDARLTSMLLQALILLLSLILRSVKERFASSIFAVIGLINIPIIKFSVASWNTLHQPSSFSLTRNSSIDSAFLTPLFYCTLSIALFYFMITIIIINKHLINLNKNA